MLLAREGSGDSRNQRKIGKVVGVLYATQRRAYS